jgi:ribosome maturation factor RimP
MTNPTTDPAPNPGGAAGAADRLAAVLAPPLEAIGIVLYDIEITGTGRTRTLRVLVDRAAEYGGVDLETVTAATEALAPVLDEDRVVASVLPGTYLLEVSSPGLERPLRTPAHFQGAIGSAVSLKATGADGTNRRDRVVLVAADDDAIEVEIDGTRERVVYGDIVQARTVFEWGPQPKPGKAKVKAGSKAGTSGKAKPKGPTSKPTVTAPSYEDATR